MKIDLITKEDLADFKTQLIEEIKALLQPQKKIHKKWLRSAEVRNMLNISPGNLQNLRIMDCFHLPRLEAFPIMR